MSRFLLWHAISIFIFLMVTLAILSTGWDEEKFGENIALMAQTAGKAVQQRYLGQSASQVKAAIQQLPPSEQPLRFIEPAEAMQLSERFTVQSHGIVFEMRETDEVLLIGLGLQEGALAIGPLPYTWPWSGSYSIPLLGVLGLVALLGGLALVYPQVRRLRRLREATDKIQAGDLSTRVIVSPVGDEIDVVTHHFNAMAKRVQEHIRQQEMLLHAVSHECRTPIARLRFALELVREGISSEKELHYVSECSEALAEIQQIVEEVMTYARFEADPYLQRESTELVGLLKTSIKGIDWPPTMSPPELRCDSEILIDVDCQLFCRVLSNLLRNAGRHAQACVCVQATRVENAVRVVVSDDGTGVPEHERERIFEPFARVDTSRSRDSGGVGLGLALVQAIVRAHGGSVCVQDSQLGGAAFVTIWPDSQ